jgi:hypothetical protein
MRWFIIRIAAMLLAAASVSPGATEIAEPEDQLKAATVLAILQNSKWAAENGKQQLVVCVWGRQAIIDALRQTLDGKIVNGRTVRVTAATAAMDTRCCQVMYMGTGRKAEMQRLLPGAAANRSLTIGEDDRFLDSGGDLNLYIADGHMAFEANLPALEETGVSISSKLLRFGRVRGKTP